MLSHASWKIAPLLAALAGTLVLCSAKAVAPERPSEHLYLMSWDDRIDGRLEEGLHECTCLLTHANGKISGTFIGPVGGTEREAVLTGEFFARGALATLQQHEDGYVCAYQLQASGEGVHFGTWRDTKGRRGEVKLVRVE